METTEKKTEKLCLTLTPTEKKKAEELSIKILKQQNVSGLFAHFINNTKL